MTSEELIEKLDSLKAISGYTYNGQVRLFVGGCGCCVDEEIVTDPELKELLERVFD